jgi:hypothetical protein
MDRQRAVGLDAVDALYIAFAEAAGAAWYP